MKPLLFLLFLFGLLNGYAQDSLVSLSRFEQWGKQPGKMLATELQLVGTINLTEFYVITRSDLQSASQQKAVLIKHMTNRLTDVADVRTLYIAPDDLPGVIRFLDSMVVRAGKEIAPGERLFTYVTNDNLQLGLYQREGVTDLYLGRLLLEQKTVFMPSVFSFNRRRVADVLSLLRQSADVMGLPPTAMVK